MRATKVELGSNQDPSPAENRVFWVLLNALPILTKQQLSQSVHQACVAKVFSTVTAKKPWPNSVGCSTSQKKV